MKTLYIQNQDNLSMPNVMLDVASGKCEISGNSYMENACNFYHQILDWLATYIQQRQGALSWDIRLGYYNSSSKKGLTSIIRQLSDYHSEGGRVIINWYYHQDDLDVLEDIEDLIEYYQFRINAITYPTTYQETWLRKPQKAPIIN